MPALISHFIRRRDETATRMPERELSKEMRWQHLQQFGENALVFPVMTDGDLHTFGDARGMITYGRKMGFVYALADPLANAQNSEALVDQFIDAFRDPVFVACDKRTAEMASSRGYLVNHLGQDTLLDLKTFTFAGGDKKRLRYSQNWLKSTGGFVTEDLDRDIDPNEIHMISQAWQGTRVSHREIAFLNKTMSITPQPGVRRFYAVSNANAVLGFIEFDPKFRDGNLVGYLASTKRRVPQDTTYLDLAIMTHAIRTFQNEGIGELDLGLSPLLQITKPSIGKECRWLRHAFRSAFNARWVNSRLFNFQGLAEHKARFRGTQRPVYICLPNRGSNLMRMVGFLILTKIV